MVATVVAEALVVAVGTVVVMGVVAGTLVVVDAIVVVAGALGVVGTVVLRGPGCTDIAMGTEGMYQNKAISQRAYCAQQQG